MFDEGGRLTEQIRRKPYCVLLLDEIEKAHPDIYNLLLQILEDGCLTDSAGRTVSFSNVLIIMTSNIGVKKLAETKTVGFSNSKSNGEAKKKAMLSELKSFMSPELLGRFLTTLPFPIWKTLHALKYPLLKKGSPNLAVHLPVSQRYTLLSQSRHFQKAALHERYAT